MLNHSGRYGIKCIAELKYNTDPTKSWADTVNLYERALEDDSPDLNTKSAVVREYLTSAYKRYIDMGVDVSTSRTSLSSARWPRKSTSFIPSRRSIRTGTPGRAR